MEGVGRRGRARRHVQLAENVADVPVDRSFAQAQLVGNLSVGATVEISRNTWSSRAVKGC